MKRHKIFLEMELVNRKRKWWNWWRYFNEIFNWVYCFYK